MRLFGRRGGGGGIRHVLCQYNVLPYPLQVGGQVNDKMFLISTDARRDEHFREEGGATAGAECRWQGV